MAETKRQPRTLSFGLNFLLSIRRDQLGFYEAMRDGYGDAVRLRLGPYRSWLLFHPDYAEHVLTRHWQSFIRFERLMEVIAQWTGENILVAEGIAWRDRRRKVLPAFQSKRLPTYGEQAVRLASLLSDRLEEQADDNGVVHIEVDTLMACLALDIACAAFFAAGPPSNGAEIEASIKLLSDTAFRESTAPMVLPDWLPIPNKNSKRRAIAAIHALVDRLVDARLDGDSGDHGDLLSMLVEQHERDRRAIRDDALSLLIAGHETSGALLSWVFHCLARSPDWLEKVIAEIRQTLPERRPRADDLRAMPILRAVVEEVLRLYPPAYALFPRRATEDVVFEGFTVKSGELVQITPYVMHRDPRWFPEPERFDPARFLVEADWPRYAYLPFGAGPRSCIGQTFGLLEVYLVVATLLQRWRPVEHESVTEPEAKFSLRPKGGLRMTWRAI